MPGLFDSPQQGGGLLGAGGNIGAGLNSFAHSDALLPAIANMISGFATGQRADPQGMALQQMQSTYDALLKAGAPEHIARAASQNPKEFGQYAAPYLDTAPKLLETGTDPLTGQKTYAQQRFQGGNISMSPLGNAGPSGVFPTVGSMSAPSGAPGTAGAPGSMEGFKKATESGVTGEALYDYLPTGAKEFVKSLVEGRTNLSPMSLRNPAMLPFMQAAQVIDPQLDMNNPQARAAAIKDWRAGKGAESQRALNQALHHVADTLIPRMENMANYSLTPVNMVKNLAGEVTGSDNPGNFRTAAHAVSEEISKIFKQNNLSDHEIRAWEQNLNPNMSPQQMHGQVQTLMELLNGGLEALNDKRLNGVGAVMHGRMGPMVTETGQKDLAKIQSWVGGGQQQQPAAAQPQTAPAGTPQPGAVMKGYRFKGGNPADQGSWEKVQ